MPEKLPKAAEFEFGQNAITHLPTGAIWTTRGTELRAFKPRGLGAVMAGGDYYSEGEVRKLAALLVQRPALSRKEVEERLDRRLQYAPRNRARGLGEMFRNSLHLPVQADEHGKADDDRAEQ